MDQKSGLYTCVWSNNGVLFTQDGYDLTIGTSDKGEDISNCSSLPQFKYATHPTIYGMYFK